MRGPRAGLLGDDREPPAPRPLPRDRDVLPARHRERRAGRGRGCRAHPARPAAGRLAGRDALGDQAPARAAAGGRARRRRAALRFPCRRSSVRSSTTFASRLAPVAPDGHRGDGDRAAGDADARLEVCGGVACRSPIAVVKLTHCARLSTIQTTNTSQKVVEAGEGQHRQAADDDPGDDHRPAPLVRPSSQRITGPVAMPISEPDPEHPADMLAVELDDVAQEGHDERLGSRRTPGSRRWSRR